MLDSSKFEQEMETLASKVEEEEELTVEVAVGRHSWPRQYPLSILYHTGYIPSGDEILTAIGRTRAMGQAAEQIAEVAFYEELNSRVSDSSSPDRNP